ncbi:MAG: hypothetical protein R3E50_02115 [Halioglobus sp.]
MTVTQVARAAALLLCLPLGSAIAQVDADTNAGSNADGSANVVEERTMDAANGAIKVCGEGAGLDPCLDANGQTYSQEVHGPGIDDESDSELAAEVAHSRGEPPAAGQDDRPAGAGLQSGRPRHRGTARRIAMSSEIACHSCDLLVDVAGIKDGASAFCPRCGCFLTRYRRDAYERVLALASAGLVFLVLANSYLLCRFPATGWKA